MKKGVHNYKKYVFLGLALIMCVFSISCGLDVYYILYPPSDSQIVNENTEALGRYFSFRTADVENKGMDIYTGTAVIYKIYNTLSQLTTDSFSINNYNSEFSDKGYNRAESLGYQKMILSNNDMQVVYELATPFDIQLTPTQIETLIGNNTIFADTGNIKVSYRHLPIDLI